jgi:hypothetical protein
MENRFSGFSESGLNVGRRGARGSRAGFDDAPARGFVISTTQTSMSTHPPRYLAIAIVHERPTTEGGGGARATFDIWS